MITRHGVAAACLITAVSACGGSSSAAPPEAAPKTLTVLAAASLSGVLPSLGKAFEVSHPGVRVVFSFGASSTLAQQVAAGAPADVFASASSAVMKQVVDAGDAAAPRVFAQNEAEIAVYPPSAAKVTGLADLGTPGLKVALCQPEVPCGSIAKKVLDRAGVVVTPVTQGLDVKGTLATVISGETDAAIVYVTDVRAAGAKVIGVEIPTAQNASTSYEVATISASKQVPLASSFADLLLSPAGQQGLSAAGFGRA